MLVLNQKNLLKFLLVLFSAFFIVIRKPDSLYRAQFYAEDGAYWFGQAYEYGPLKSLFMQAAGYMQTSGRLAGSLSMLLPIRWVPLFFNLLALFIHVLPIIYLVYRFPKISLLSRFFICFIYLTMTNTGDTYLNITNAQWYLALSLFLVMIVEPSQYSFWKIIDILIVFIGGLSGPFSLFLLFPVFYLVYRKKITLSSWKVQMICFTTLVQLMTLMLSGIRQLGAVKSLHLLDIYNIFYRQILWGVLAGPSGYEFLVTHFPFVSVIFLITTIFSLALVAYAMFKAPAEIQAFILFSIFIFISSLLNPTVAPDNTRTIYQVMFDASGLRYWLIPMICMVVIMMWGSRGKVGWVQKVSRFFMLILLFFTFKHLIQFSRMRYIPYADYHWQEEVSEFEQLPQGGSKTFKIHPGWEMTLIKK